VIVIKTNIFLKTNPFLKSKILSYISAFVFSLFITAAFAPPGFCQAPAPAGSPLHSQQRPQDNAAVNKYPWLNNYDIKNSIAESIPPPAAYSRQAASADSFESWLRGLPLKQGRPPVYLYNKTLKKNQGAHYAVVDIDCGTRDLQQCADAVMRLRAEYFFAKGDIDSIKFNTGSGKIVSFNGWLKGAPGGPPPVKAAAKKPDYKNFQKYMLYIFAYAGTHSLSKSLKKVENINDIKAGDIFIKGGFPGHAVLVADVAVNEKTGHKVFLLLQSYMPAQDVHILVNPNDKNLSPWYDINFGATLETPEWDFIRAQLMRF